MNLFSKPKTLFNEINMRRKEKNTSFGFGGVSFWLRIVNEFISKGNTSRNVPKNNLGEGDHFFASNHYYTKNGLKKPYIVAELPETLHRGFFDDLKRIVTQTAMDYNLKENTDYVVSLNHVLNSERFDMKLGKRHIKGNWLNCVREYERIQKANPDRDVKEVISTDNNHSHNVKRKVNSFLYMKEAVEQKAGFFNSRIFLEVVIEGDISDMQPILKEIESEMIDYTNQHNVIIKPLFLTMTEYQKVFTPSSSPKRKGEFLERSTQKEVFTDDIISSFSTGLHGRVGDDFGVYHGTDIISQNPVFLDTYSGTGNNTILVTAEAGEGKTATIINICLNYALDNLFDVIIHDYEGIDYKSLGNLCDAVNIDFGSNTGNYVNSIVIQRPLEDDSQNFNEELKSYSIERTREAFEILLSDNPRDTLTTEQNTLFSNLIESAYLRFGVTNEPATWVKSENMTFFHLYKELEHFLNERTPTFKPDLYDFVTVEEVKKMRNALQPYFAEGGMNSHWFKKPISLNEIIDNKMVIFNYNQAGQSQQNTNYKKEALRDLFIGDLTLRKAKVNRSNKRKTVIVFEELQRYFSSESSLTGVKLVGECTSGGRKLGTVNYLVTNAPQRLVDAKDSELKMALSPIFSNINKFMIGGFQHVESSLSVLRTYGIENADGYIREICKSATNKEDNSGGAFKHCFLLVANGFSTVVKQSLHPELAKSDLFSSNKTNKLDTIRKQEAKEFNIRNNIDDIYLRDEQGEFDSNYNNLPTTENVIGLTEK